MGRPTLFKSLLLAGLLWLCTSCSRDLPVRTCSAELQPAELAWKAPQCNLWPQPKNLEKLEGAPWSPEKPPVFFCENPEWRDSLAGIFPELQFTDRQQSANAIVSLEPGLASLPEGAYQVSLTADSINLGGRDLPGAVYAIHTLKLLLALELTDPVKIQDWPTFPVRGLMLHTGPESGPTHRRLIKDIMGPLKLNLLLLESEYTQWESHPELWEKAYAISKPELRKTVEFAKAQLVEPVPLIQTLSHMGWFFANGRNQELGQWSNSYCFPPENEAAWATVLDIYQEAIDVFQPRLFHIGFDEVRSLRGIFPGSDRPVEEVIATHSERLREWLARRNVQTIMWADTLVHRSESAAIGFARSPEAAQFLREHVSKEILLVDWQYKVDPPRFPETELLIKAGFKLLGAGWNDSPTTRAQAQSLAEFGGEGLIQTTWPGRVLNDRVVEGSEFYQFAEIVSAAEAAWNGGSNSVGNPAPMFRRLWSNSTPPEESSGTLVAFQGEESDIFEASTQEFGGVRFRVGRQLEVTEPIELKVETSCSEIQFLLHARGDRKPGTAVATLQLRLDGGEIREIPLRWAKEVEALEDGVLMYRAPVAWTSGSRRMHRWGRACPGARVEAVRLVPAQEGATLVVEGMTLLEKAISDF